MSRPQPVGSPLEPGTLVWVRNAQWDMAEVNMLSGKIYGKSMGNLLEMGRKSLEDGMKMGNRKDM